MYRWDERHPLYNKFMKVEKPRIIMELKLSGSRKVARNKKPSGK